MEEERKSKKEENIRMWKVEEAAIKITEKKMR